MWISKKLVYVNCYALTLNALLFCLLVFKVWPVALPIAAFLVLLVGLRLLLDALDRAVFGGK